MWEKKVFLTAVAGFVVFVASCQDGKQKKDAAGTEQTSDPAEDTEATPLPVSDLVTSVPCSQESDVKSAAASDTDKTILFINNTENNLNVYWLDYAGERQAFGKISSFGTLRQQTFVGHAWVVTDDDDQCVVLASNTEVKGERVCIGPNDGTCLDRPVHPFYGKVVDDDGIQFVGSEQVDDAAFKRAQYLVNKMLQNRPDVRKKMRAINFRVAIIAKQEVLTDLPDYHDLKGKKTEDGRDYDTGTRGVGNVDVCSVGEENLTCDEDQAYSLEDIMIHEFAHSVKFNLDAKTDAKIEAAYKNAIDQKLYDQSIYMMNNSHEFWAEASQIWFRATQRTDVNDGHNTPELLRDHDPELYEVLEAVYGSTEIEHIDGCPY